LIFIELGERRKLSSRSRALARKGLQLSLEKQPQRAKGIGQQGLRKREKVRLGRQLGELRAPAHVFVCIFPVGQAGGHAKPWGQGRVLGEEPEREKDQSLPPGCPDQMRVSRHTHREKNHTMIYMAF